jgi:hypothetical protein
MATTNPTSVNDKEQCLAFFCNVSESFKNRSKAMQIDAENAQKLTDMFYQFQSPQLNPSQPNNITPPASLDLGDMFAPTDVSPTDVAASTTAKLSAATAASASGIQSTNVVSTVNQAAPTGTAAPRLIYPMAGSGMPKGWHRRNDDDPMCKGFIAGK